MLKGSSAVRLILVLLAAGLAVVPLPRHQVERWYSTGVYPPLQSAVTPVVNLFPLALADVAAVLVALGLLCAAIIGLRRRSLPAALLRGLRTLIVLTACGYLLFLLMWGLNYQRVTLETVLDYDQSRVTREAVVGLASEAVRQVNASWAASRVTALDDRRLGAALVSQQRALGASRPVALGRPKLSILGLYFRRAAIDGMVNPFFLEIILNPDLLPAERPMVLAHEWAHLAGYAHETEASYLAWLACLDADAISRYSAWLAAYELTARALTPADRRALPALAEGPRADLRAIAERYQRSSPVVRTAARDVYDSYLRAHRVPEGIASYGAVVRLMVGVRRSESGQPMLRSRQD
jgi:hypothetical protein